MIKAVLWDNDGVLADTEALFFEATRAAFARAGLSLTQARWAAHYLGEGRTSKDIALSLGCDPDRITQLIDERNNRYRSLLQRPPQLRPQVSETLAALFGHVKMALVTDCRREQLNLVHETNNVLGFFDVIVTGDDCSLTKPHPAPYLAAVKALQVDPRHCIAVEDSPKGLASANAAGIPCIVVPHDLTLILQFPNALSVERDVSGVLRHIKYKAAL
jgi:HAD superfamily hydrolase (TIGR01509 family)